MQISFDAEEIEGFWNHPEKLKKYNFVLCGNNWVKIRPQCPFNNAILSC